MAPKLKVVKSQSSGLESLVNDYMAHLGAKGLSPRSTGQASAVLRRQFLPWCDEQGITKPDELTQRVLDRWSNYLQSDDRQLAKESVRTYLRTVAMFLKWAQRDGSIAASVHINGPRKERRVIDVLSRDQIQKMEDRAATERDKLVIRLLADTGIRLGELLGLRVGDLREDGRERYIKVHGKGSRDRLVPMSPALYQRLKRFADKSRPDNAASDKIFLTNRRSHKTGDYEAVQPRSIENMITAAGEAAKLERSVHPHLFRHSFATWCLRRGMNPMQLQDILGHSDLTMISQVYKHLNQSDAHSAMMAVLRAED
jgi:site-specific recombinase XerD